MAPLSLALLLTSLAALPASAATGPEPATPANTVQVQALVTASLSNADQSSGLAGARFNFAQANNATDAQAILAQMRAVIEANAKTQQFKTIGSQTVQSIADSIKSDADFNAVKDQLGTLPDMLKAQLASDEFKASHDMAHLSPQDQGVYKGLQDHYDSLMSAQPPASAGDNPRETSDKSMVPMGAMPKMSPPPNGGKDAVAGAAGSIMDRFHQDYSVAAQAWANDHPAPVPGPAPGPTPAPSPNGGSGGSPNGGTTGGAPVNAGPVGYPPAEHIDHMISASPSDPANWQLRADYRLQSGDFSGAESDAERALALGGGASARVAIGEAELSLGDKSGAHDQAAAALASDPDNKRALALLHFSETYAAPAAPKAPDFGGAAGAAGGAPGASALAALSFLNAGGSPMSAADLRREIANALQLNDLGTALAYANHALAQDPNNPSLLNIRASIEARMRDFPKAEADAKAGLALAANNPALLRTLGYAQLRGGKYKDALASAGELISLDPKDAYAYAMRAHAYGSMGDRDAMMADLGRAAALDPRYQATEAEMAKLVQLPSDKDFLFLFPGESAPAAKTAAPAARGRRFGLLVGASALGGLLLALGLLTTVLAPLKEKVTSAFTRVPAAAPDGATPQPASINGLMPGLIRGQYEISRQIGAGGMGMVFAGTDRSLGRPVAIKKMRDELRINPQERARFVIEAKTVAALHHPNIVDIYAIAEDGQDVFLIFEFVAGKTAHELIQASGRLPIAEAARVVRASADALGFAHSRGVIHRDMKPSNVMVDGAGRVKVMDFGIARMAKDSMTRFSMTNTVVGTPPYMAPEQERGQVRKESDVYALAVCAYEMLTGKLPFVGIGAGMLMNKINMSYIAPSRATAGLPEALDEVFAKAFQADPDRRYRTPQEFADALESALPSAARA